MRNYRASLYWCIFSILLFSVSTETSLAQKHEEVTAQEDLRTQDSLSVQVVKFDDVPVRAGESFSFTFVLDKAPTVTGGGIMYVVSGPGGAIRIQTSANLVAGERECRGSILIPAAAPGGTWTLTATGLSDGVSIRPFRSNPRTFQVIANQGLVFPTSAEIVVNPSQQQLLRLEARHLQHKIEDLKAAIVEFQLANQQSRITQILRTNIDDAIKALDATETDFERRATAKDQAILSKSFFGDLRLNYDTVVLDLDRHSANWHRPRLVSVSERPLSDTSYPILAQAALRAFEGNETAYNVVAETGLTFDLKVSSHPAGALVSYHRRGDPPHHCPDPTTTVIPSLPVAIWYVKVEKPGYKTQEREYDAIHSTERVLDVDLAP